MATKEIKHSKLKILVCESDLRVLNRLNAWIKAMGEDVIITDDGISAISIFENDSPDIIFVSQNLKNMGGLELIENIRKKDPNQVIVLMLGEDDTTLFKRSIDLQVDKYINKPVEASLLFKVVEDLSQEKIWHKEFKIQKRMLEDYKDAVDLSFSVSKHNPNGDVIYVNDLFCSTIKISLQDAMKGIINPLNNPNANMKEVWGRLQEDLIYRDRQVFKIEGRTENIIDITAVAMVDENNEVYEYLVFSNDVSDIVHSARKIKQQEVDQKIQKLTHEKELNRVKDSFLTVFTHELRTPLNAIINFSDYVKKHLSKEEFKKRDTLLNQVEEINSSGWHMLEMINNLMEAIKLKDSNISFDISSFSLEQLVKNVIKNNKSNLDDKKLRVIIKNDFTIDSDETRMFQIINNLLSNAIKYSNKEIAVVSKADDKEFIVEILDDGDGFKNKDKVFNLFEQADDDDMTRTATGTGVGLYIVKQLCDKMGYSIYIKDSTKLGGARVVIKGKRKMS